MTGETGHPDDGQPEIGGPTAEAPARNCISVCAVGCSDPPLA